MRTVVDYSSARPPMTWLESMKVEGVCRYLTIPDDSFNKAKQLRKPEYDLLLQQGFTVLLNWEHEKATWMKGYAEGRGHGAEARRQARALGAPDSAIIIQSVDTNPHPDLYHLALDYQRGFNDGGGLGPQGMYSTDGLLRAAKAARLIRTGWQTMSRGWYSNAQDSPAANLIQLSNHTASFGEYDVNEVRAPHWGAVNECFFGYRCALTH